MCSPEGGHDRQWGQLMEKSNLAPAQHLGEQEEGGSPWDTPALLAPSPHPQHATSSCPRPLESFRPTQPESPDFSCSPHMNVTPPQVGLARWHPKPMALLQSQGHPQAGHGEGCSWLCWLLEQEHCQWGLQQCYHRKSSCCLMGSSCPPWRDAGPGKPSTATALGPVHSAAVCSQNQGLLCSCSEQSELRGWALAALWPRLSSSPITPSSATKSHPPTLGLDPSSGSCHLLRTGDAVTKTPAEPHCCLRLQRGEQSPACPGNDPSPPPHTNQPQYTALGGHWGHWAEHTSQGESC